jgi:hypothetical protein
MSCKSAVQRCRCAVEALAKRDIIIWLTTFAKMDD